MVLDLRQLPPDLQRLLHAWIHHVCIKDMTPAELSVVRMVNVNLATAFYKRCVMLTMLDRYKPFIFLGVEREDCRRHHKYYDLHGDFQRPCRLPKEHLDLRDFRRIHATRDATNQLDVMRLELMHCQVDHGFRSFTAETLARKLLNHRVRVHQHLKEQEKHLFNLGHRRKRRSEHMNDPSHDLTPRKWAWV
tara:strand:- start:126 stop:698 length:573 start_codon:yes stop_codon:yes gene_type:complete